jgi:hypothetical protein
MPTFLTCSCGQRYRMADTDRRRVVKCGKCRNVIPVPDPFLESLSPFEQGLIKRIDRLTVLVERLCSWTGWILALMAIGIIGACFFGATHR